MVTHIVKSQDNQAQGVDVLIPSLVEEFAIFFPDSNILQLIVTILGIHSNAQNPNLYSKIKIQLFLYQKISISFRIQFLSIQEPLTSRVYGLSLRLIFNCDLVQASVH